MTSTQRGAQAETIRLQVDRPANGGAAVGRDAGGRAVFVHGAIPGETVIARVTDARPTYATAQVVEVLDASPHRVTSLCDAAAHGSGCCDLAFINPDHARTLKSDVLVDVLTRIGHLDSLLLDRLGVTTERVAELRWREAAAAPGSGTAVGWRTRTRLAVDADGRAGFHERRGSGIVAGYPCAQPDPTMLDGVVDISVGVTDGFTPGTELAIVLDDRGDRHITEIAPAVAPGTGRAQRGRGRRAAQRHRRDSEAPRALAVIEGDASAEHQVGERSWRIGITGFWQGHRAAPASYAATVGEFVAAAKPSGVTVAWDLYGGAGVFAATLLDQLGATTVHLVDSDSAALSAAAETFGDDARVVCHQGEVATVVGGLPVPDVVVLDPPRTGAGARVVDAIVAAGPEVVIQVGCDVARFARDIALFTERGYQLRALRGFDAFPLTHHIEAIACLVRPTSLTSAGR